MTHFKNSPWKISSKYFVFFLYVIYKLRFFILDVGEIINYGYYGKQGWSSSKELELELEPFVFQQSHPEHVPEEHEIGVFRDLYSYIHCSAVDSSWDVEPT